MVATDILAEYRCLSTLRVCSVVLRPFQDSVHWTLFSQLLKLACDPGSQFLAEMAVRQIYSGETSQTSASDEFSPCGYRDM